jgi:hypothetical protein
MKTNVNPVHNAPVGPSPPMLALPPPDPSSPGPTPSPCR